MRDGTASSLRAPSVVLVTSLMVFGLAVAAFASPAGTITTGARSETLWIFDADFSDLVGDNAGWVSEDRSGTPGPVNYWHRDTLRPCPRPIGNPGTLSWWCGTIGDSTWAQSRGYGNDWVCYLERDFPLASWSIGCDMVALEFDQRYAIEKDYDYGYVDISADNGATWSTLASCTNSGFAGTQGHPAEWTDPESHDSLDISAYAGSDIRLRFRFESDSVYSSEDLEDNTWHSVKDGAWQLDNFLLSVNGAPVWTDDCEGPGDNGWEHDDLPASGQTGVSFYRGQYGSEYDLWTHRPGYPGEPADQTWMYGATDFVEGRMVNGQDSWLISPPIDISGAESIVCVWYGWVDFPLETHDQGRHLAEAADTPESIEIGDTSNSHPLGIGPLWSSNAQNWDPLAGNDWLKVAWAVQGGVPEVGYQHMAGLLLDRVRIGIPVTTDVEEDVIARTVLVRSYPNPFNPSTTIEYSLASRCHARLQIVDLSGRVVATLVDGPAGPGRAAVMWDGTTDEGSDAASGIYFVALEADGEISTDKITLLK
jgi:hypothetical protein